ALPAYGRNPTAQIVQLENEIILVDCGEGTQMRIAQYGFKGIRINHIFISHCHGDHYFGLVALISSMSLLGRINKLHLYCPEFIKEVIDFQLQWDLGFEIEYHFLKEGIAELLLNESKYEVHCFPVYHSIPTHGFLFLEKKRKRILLPEKLREYEIPKYYYSKLTDGFDYEDAYGNIIKNEWVTSEGHPDKSYAYTADTLFNTDICKYFMNVDLLYHESTYLQNDEQKAGLRFHSTAKQAAEIAKYANCNQLIIGHFSSRYKDLSPFLLEAKPVFEKTQLALEGLEFEV
ncbi:MAG: ribonuclease Z, partial [Bacteroidia bacterium]|nr:ribonuclease Z [Bacteroidia bacterium]